MVQLIATAMAYAALGFVLYRARVTSDAPVWDSDLLVFYGPALAALVLTTFLAWRAFSSQNNGVLRLTLSVGTAILLAGVAAWAYAVCAFNRYGT